MTAAAPAPPYYAVIFSSQRTPGDDGYADMAQRMVDLAREQPGFLGIESVRNADGAGITVSYWQTEADIARWKQNTEHRIAQENGKQRWYSDYTLRIARVERAYSRSDSAR